MPEEKLKRIIIASVLKPVNDTRMFAKMAVSLQAINQYDVHVIGYPARTKPNSSVVVHELYPFKRISSARVFAPISILKKIIQLKPSLLIITTHELLWISLLAKMLTGCRLIYDIQENYYYNILYTKTFPFLLRPLLAVYVRFKEILTSPFIHHFLLAETGYGGELSFPGNRKTVLENKVLNPGVIHRIRKTGKFHLLFSGTLAESTGVFTAIEIALKLHAIDQGITLSIIGYCSQHETLYKLKNTIKPYPFIELIGGDQLVPHERILEAIKSADFGIIAYPQNPSTRSSTPTKLYEYLGYKLPILLVNYPPWVAVCKPYDAAVVFEESKIHPAALFAAMRSQVFYPIAPTAVYWETEKPKFVAVIKTLLS